MPQVDIQSVPKDAEGLVNFLQRNFTSVKDALARAADRYGKEDIEITESSAGVILTSPNGTRFRVQVNNAGSLTTTAL